MTGMNVDPLNPYGAPRPDELLRIGMRWVRHVSRPGVEPYCAAMRVAGLMVLGVVAKESQGFVHGDADVWQFGNEPDSDGPSSWTMSPDEYIDQFALYHDTYPNFPWIAAGLASGSPTWWSQVKARGGLDGVTGFAVHPYNKTAAQAKTLLAAYQKITPNLPVWVTEWNRPVGEVVGFDYMLRQNAAMRAWFAWSDLMVPGFGVGYADRMLGAA